MKQITAYKLSNGDIVENEAEAVKKENLISFQKKLDKFVDSNVAYSENKTMVYNLLNENAEELKELFNLIK